MVNTPAVPGYELATKLMGYGTVMDGHAGVKGDRGKPRIAHEIDLNKDIHYKLQCYQATHGPACGASASPMTCSSTRSSR